MKLTVRSLFANSVRRLIWNICGRAWKALTKTPNAASLLFHTCLHIPIFAVFLLPFPGSYLHQMWVTSCNRCEQPSRKLNTSSNVELITMGPAAPGWEDTVILCHVVLCLSAVGAAWWPPRGPQMTGRKWIRFPFLPVEESYDCDDANSVFPREVRQRLAYIV